jgi:hypothetical protein
MIDENIFKGLEFFLVFGLLAAIGVRELLVVGRELRRRKADGSASDAGAARHPEG